LATASKGTWTYVSSKLGKVDPETKSIAKEIFEAAKKAGHEIWFMWGMGTSTDHRTGNALDLMVRNKAAGDWIRNYIWTHRKRLRLKHVIWWQHITSTVVQPGKVRPMADRGDPTANHKDHPHVLFFPGAYQAPPTSGGSGGGSQTPAKPGQLAVDGDLGPKTIKRWQEVMKTKADGKISEKSDLVRAVQRRLRDTVDSRLVIDGDGDSLAFGVPRKTIGALQRYLKVPVTTRLSKSNSTTIKALQRRLNEGRF
jgi:hypothetical protein